MMHIKFPVAFVWVSSAVSMFPVSVNHVLFPPSLVNIAVHLVERPLSMCFIVLPISWVYGPGRPLLGTIPMSQFSIPLSSVCTSTIKFECWSVIIDTCIFGVTLIVLGGPVRINRGAPGMLVGVDAHLLWSCEVYVTIITFTDIILILVFLALFFAIVKS